MCQTGISSNGESFVRCVQAVPELMCILCADEQLKEMIRNCTDTYLFSPIGIDPTFQVGDFFITPMKYWVSSPLTNSGRPVSVYHQRVKVRSFYDKRWMLYIAAQCTAESINPRWVSKYHSISTVMDKIRRERQRENRSYEHQPRHTSYTKMSTYIDTNCMNI